MPRQHDQYVSTTGPVTRQGKCGATSDHLKRGSEKGEPAFISTCSTDSNERPTRSSEHSRVHYESARVLLTSYALENIFLTFVTSLSGKVF